MIAQIPKVEVSKAGEKINNFIFTPVIWGSEKIYFFIPIYWGEKIFPRTFLRGKKIKKNYLFSLTRFFGERKYVPWARCRRGLIGGFPRRPPPPPHTPRRRLGCVAVASPTSLAAGNAPKSWNDTHSRYIRKSTYPPECMTIRV